MGEDESRAPGAIRRGEGFVCDRCGEEVAGELGHGWRGCVRTMEKLYAAKVLEEEQRSRELAALSVAARATLNEIQKWGAPPWTRACVDHLELALVDVTSEVDAERLANALSVLATVEWNYGEDEACPQCLATKEEGHDKECALAKALYAHPSMQGYERSKQELQALRALVLAVVPEDADTVGLRALRCVALAPSVFGEQLCAGAPLGTPGPRKCAFTDLGFGGVVLGCRLAEGHGGGHKPGAPVIDGERCSATPPAVALRGDAASIVGGMRCMLRVDHPGQHVVGTYRW